MKLTTAVIFLLIILPGFAIGQQCINGNVRLVRSVSSPAGAGRVEVCKNRTWGTVCDSGWGNSDARVVCKQLGYGYTTGVTARTNAYYGQGSGPIHISYVGCTGGESTLLSCSYSRPSSYCSHWDDAGVTCGWRTVQYNISNNDTAIRAIRLISNGGNNLGRIELLYNGNWGTICARRYYYWFSSEAVVACRMIGYSGAACAISSSSWYGSISSPSRVWMSNLQCTGSEETLDSCSFSGWTNSYCSSYYYKAGIVCTNISQTDKPYNIQLINSTTRTLMIHWMNPSSETFDTRSVQNIRYDIIYSWNSGASSRSIIAYAQSVDGEVSYTIGSLSRETNYTIQVRTAVDYYYCSSYAYGLYSDPVSFQTNATARSSRIPIRLVSPSSGHGVDFLGRVEVFHDNQWGTICDDFFSITEGNVVCWMLNFTQGALCTFGSARYGQGTGPIWLDNVDCSSADDEVLEDCSFPGWGIHDCHHSEDVSVICRSNLPPVKNLTVTAVSAISVTVRWNQYVYSSLPVDEAQFYVLYSSLELNQSTVISSVSQTKYTLKNLQIQKQYNISIRAQIQFCCIYRSPCTTLYGEFSNEVRFMTEKPVYFQLRMTPVLNCLSFTDPSANNITDRLLQVRRAIVKSFNTDGCPNCGLTYDDIGADEFSCRGGLTKHIIYRAAMVGRTQQHDAQALVSLLHSWVVSGSASITVFFHRLHLDKDCETYLGNLSEPDCPLQHGPDSQADQEEGSTQGEISSYLIVAIVFGVILILGTVLVIMVVVMKYYKSKRRGRFRPQGINHQPYDIAQKFSEKQWFDDKTTVAVCNNQAYGNSLRRPCAEMPSFPIYDIIPLQPVSSQLYPDDQPCDDSENQVQH